MRVAITSLIILSVIAVSNAQTFEHAYGTNYEIASQVIPAIDGGYIMAGATTFPGGPAGATSDILIVKTDSAGNLQWSETIKSGFDDEAISIQPYKDSTYIVCGNSYDNTIGKLNVFRLRLSVSGAVLEQKLYKAFDAERVSGI